MTAWRLPSTCIDKISDKVTDNHLERSLVDVLQAFLAALFHSLHGPWSGLFILRLRGLVVLVISYVGCPSHVHVGPPIQIFLNRYRSDEFGALHRNDIRMPHLRTCQ